MQCLVEQSTIHLLWSKQHCAPCLQGHPYVISSRRAPRHVASNDAALTWYYLAAWSAWCQPDILAAAQDLLEGIGRSHGLGDVRAALADIEAVAPPSWSLDLMCGLPHLTMAAWKASLAEAVAMRPPHISVYDLQASAVLPPHMPKHAWENGPHSAAVARTL